MARFILVAVIAFLCGCGNSNEPRQPDSKFTNNGGVKPMDLPFMDHPSGQFGTAVDAMADAIKRLRALPDWKNWITFSAQGMGSRVDSYHIADIRIRRDELEFQQPIQIDIGLVIKRANVPETCLIKNGDTYSIAKATPIQAARVLDVIFRHYMAIRPHTGEGDDYALGAEW